ncbi:MAG: hypothetical protein WA771_10375 [Chthoniobacterales bacterium]
MQTTKLKLVTIVADRLWLDALTEELLTLGATGYTLSDAHGQGARGLRPLDWEGSNVRIEIIASPEVAGKIIDHMASQYFDRHGFIAFLQDVEVVRGDKYV